MIFRARGDLPGTELTRKAGMTWNTKLSGFWRSLNGSIGTRSRSQTRTKSHGLTSASRRDWSSRRGGRPLLKFEYVIRWTEKNERWSATEAKRRYVWGKDEALRQARALIAEGASLVVVENHQGGVIFSQQPPAVQFSVRDGFVGAFGE